MPPAFLKNVSFYFEHIYEHFFDPRKPFFQQNLTLAHLSDFLSKFHRYLLNYDVRNDQDLILNYYRGLVSQVQGERVLEVAKDMLEKREFLNSLAGYKEIKEKFLPKLEKYIEEKAGQANSTPSHRSRSQQADVVLTDRVYEKRYDQLNTNRLEKLIPLMLHELCPDSPSSSARRAELFSKCRFINFSALYDEDLLQMMVLINGCEELNFVIPQILKNTSTLFMSAAYFSSNNKTFLQIFKT